jgi:hypothetical protein
MAEPAWGSKWITHDPLNSAWTAKVLAVSNGFVWFTTRGRTCRLETDKFLREWEPKEDGDAD